MEKEWVGKKPKMKMTIVEESTMGLYVWLTEDGQIVGDDDGNYLNIQSMKGDERNIEILRNTARDFGVEGGKPQFLSGYRRVTDEEYEWQKKRMDLGLIPDELDLAAFREEQKNLEVRKRRGEIV
jgi:hypothetical protein